MTESEFTVEAGILKVFQWIGGKFGEEITQSATGAIQKKMKKRYGIKITRLNLKR